ncbi:CocE/NonD family hydrolase [Lacticaseibacillus zhaodongensis]|uniref:CocE/NonD family hydrolase n=1 Tax=Lacticaseibacillus zhaodongensis TaxID=2668065 RepID=UPI0012D2EA54|nr:CocE/NonD family hydrolase [Lacticaseibacillus zhaodongensis]
MTEFIFYQSGLEFGRFRVSSTGQEYRWLDAPNYQSFDATASQALSGYSCFDIHQVLAWWQQDRFAGRSQGKRFITDFGYEYERKDAHYWVNRGRKFALDLIKVGGKIVGFQTAQRNLVTVFVQPGYEQYTALQAWRDAGYNLQRQPFGPVQTVRVPMRDDVELSATLLLPAGAGPFSTIMERTPYGKETYIPQYQHYVARGFAVLLEDVRGRGDSAGEWVPMVHEQDDGDDTLNWIAAQSWSNGKVGMSGGSYGGYVQWAAAASGNQHLAAIVSMVTAGGPFTDTYYRTGAPFMAQAAWSFATDTRHFDKSLTDRDDWDQLMQVRPLWRMPVVGLGHEIPGFTKFMQHNRYDDFIEQGDWYARRANITVPALIQSGWYDDDGIGTTEAIAATNDYPRGQRRIILGPWLHGGNTEYDLGPTQLGSNALRHDIDLLHQQWFDHFLNGVDNGVNTGAPVEYYTVGENAWHTAETFPPAGTTRQFYLDVQTNGLQPKAPQVAGQLQYQHDPQNPVPKLISVTNNEFEFPADYAQVEQRPDVVSFTSAALVTPLRIVGQVQLDLFASSSAVDCDWDVRILDVTPDGKSVSIVEGCMNAKFRDSLRNPELLVPGKIYAFTLKTQKTSYQLPAGHKLRVDIQSSAAGFIFPNGGTAAGFDTKEQVVATQTVYTGGKQPTRIQFISDAAN